MQEKQQQKQMPLAVSFSPPLGQAMPFSVFIDSLHIPSSSTSSIPKVSPEGPH